MEQNEYRYDAFISYRHTDLDKFVAENLHKQMEAFKLPKNVLKNKEVTRTKISRVFRDRDELPLASNLEDPILDALQSSEYLVVICSPRLPESMWCKKEIQTFVKMHGRRKVLAVLIEGEPEDSFPEELLYDEEEVISETGEVKIVKKPVEPLAADFRGKTKDEMKKAMKTEILRLLAPMFGVSYDDLRQRHREQRIRKIMTVSIVAAAAGIAFGTYSTATSIKIRHQAQLLAQQQAEYLSQEARDLSEKSNRKDAVRLAYEAMTEHQGVKMPQTAQAESALAEVLGVYDGSYYAKGADHIEIEGVISHIEVSPDERFVLAADNLGNLCVINVEERNVAFQVKDDAVITDYGFLDADSFYYLSAAAGVKKVVISEQKAYLYEEQRIDNYVWEAKATPDGSTLIVSKSGVYEFVDASSLELKAKFECERAASVGELYLTEDSKLMIAPVKDGDSTYLTAINVETGKIAYRIPMPEGSVSSIVSSDSTTYILSYALISNYSGKSIVTSVNRATGEVNFVREYKELMAFDLAYSFGGQGENLLLMNKNTALMVDAQRGDVRETYQIGEKIIKCDPSGDGGFNAFTQSGECHVISGGGEYVDMAFRSIICQDVVELKHAATGMVGIRENDNRLILFNYLKNADSYVFEGELAEAISSAELGDSAKDLSNQSGFERPSFVDAYLDMEDAGLILAHYVDGRIATYDRNSKKQMASYDIGEVGIYEYYGKVNGYSVVTDGRFGYLFDKEGQLRAQIPDFSGVSADGKAVVVYGRDDNAKHTQIAVPVYDTKGLLEKTENFLRRN